MNALTPPEMPQPVDQVHKFISQDGLLRASALISVGVVQEMQSTLNAFPIASVALGRAIVGCSLMVSHLKEGHNVGVYLRGNGPLVSLYAEANFDGAVRAYTPQPHIELAANENGTLNLRDAIGIGLLQVVRGSSQNTQIHTGTVEIVSGEIGDDIAHYLHQSQQIPSVVALSVDLDKTGKIERAGGVLIELMPGATQRTMDIVQKRVNEGHSLIEMMKSGATPEDLASVFLKDFRLERLNSPPPLRYVCRCSLDRVHRSLILIGHAELDQMIEEAKPSHVTCDFCGRRYTVNVEQLKELREESFRRSLH